jgi:hypothetical protein
MSKQDQQAAIIGQVTGLRLLQDGTWRVSVEIPKEIVPENISSWSFQYIALAILEDQTAPDAWKTESEKKEKKQPEIVKRTGKPIKGRKV